MLPVAERKKGFEKYFKTPLEVNFAKIIQSFEIPYFIAETETDLTKSIEKSSENAPAIIEIETDAEYSARARKKFFKGATKKIENAFS
jgi:2-succinyl-5-enolpyruvyl-6-hydroxy-3-cyclohexene-1-carboxylate synthase